RPSRHNASPNFPPGPVKHDTASPGIPASKSTSASFNADNGVNVGGFITTALPAAMAGATLCAIKFNGKLNGLIATTTPHGTRNVNPNFPAPPGDASNGTVSPCNRRASSADNCN